ncbi:MAG: TlpA family protein disulfide reductase [Planctomycetes bacterium]|nr:TlpA family protein disulfide reductase [Planctomycetota bacterium]
MVTKRFATRAMAGFSLWAGFGSVAQAQIPAVTVEEAFKVQPRQKGVTVSTPTADLVQRCTVTAIPNPKDKSPMGYIVRDPSGQTVRQFVSYDGKSFNIIAFYVNGAEAYREVYPPTATEAYQFRWLGPNGTKWGLDKNRDGQIDEWVVISPEELSQELLQAILTKDVKRAEALTLNKANLDAVGLQGGEAQQLLARTGGVAARVAKASDDLKAGSTAEWMHLELGVPQATPADAVGTREDLVFHKTGTVLVKDGKDGANSKSFQIGEMVQVGRAWKLVDGPSVGSAETGSSSPLLFAGSEPLIAELNKLDQVQPPPATVAELAAHNAKRAAILEQIVTLAGSKADAKTQETWTKLLVDSLSSAAEVEKLDGRHILRLKQFRDAFAGKPGTVGSYAWFHHLITENSILLREGTTGLPAIQEKWRAALEEFIKANAKSDEAPEATLRLGMAFEFMNTKEGDAKAKEWYEQLSKSYVGHPHALKAAGAVKRLDSEGKTLEIAGSNLATGQAFNVSTLKEKVVVVYYFAAWSSTLADDAKKLKALVKEYGPKGLELVTICLDNDAKTAAATVATHGLPGTILHAPGGLDGSPLASQYGIIVVPHLFVAGKDGKVTNRNAQAANLEDEVKKLLP